MKLLAFDLEIAKVIPAGDKWRDHRPLGISIAATLPEDGEVKLWYGEGLPDGRHWDKMPAAQVRVLVNYLRRKADEGYLITTWNGLGFDFGVLAEESRMYEECVNLAWSHLDIMWHLFCAQGYAVGLQAVADGFGIEGKTEGMSGALAPVLWLQGEYEKVMEYVAQDVRVTLQVVETAIDAGTLRWFWKSGPAEQWAPRDGLFLIAKEAARLPVPRPPGWLLNPWPREHFTGWMRGGGS